MAGGNRSIGDRMRRAGTPDVATEIAHSWTDEWSRQQRVAVQELFAALDVDDVRRAADAAREINDMTSKRFIGLHGVIDRLVDVCERTTHDPSTRESGSKPTR